MRHVIRTAVTTVGLVGLGLGVAAPVGRASSPQAPSEPPPAFLAECGVDCTVGGIVDVTHPTWGVLRLVVGSSSSDPASSSCNFVALDQADDVVWSYRSDGCPYGARPLQTTVDANGQVFIAYTTGRYDGVTVLRPTVEPGGFEDFGSLPGVPPSGTSDGQRFYQSTTWDVDGDGGREIVSVEATCDPDCATGPAYFRTYAWSGVDYFTELCAGPAGATVTNKPDRISAINDTVLAGTCGVPSSIVIAAEDEVWYSIVTPNTAGWAPIDSFTPGAETPPWPADADPWSEGLPPVATVAIPAPPTTPAPVVTQAPDTQAPANSCGDYRFNNTFPIRRCDQGSAVWEIQWSLSDNGYDVEADGYFGPATEAAVRQFQQSAGLAVDGLVGAETWGLLVAAPGVDANGDGVIDPSEVWYD